MSIVGIIVVLAIVGFLLYAVETWIPMDPTVKRIIQIVVIICLVIFLLRAFGVWGEVMGARI